MDKSHNKKGGDPIENLYLNNSYLREQGCTITHVSADRRWISLDQTIIYPGGGGQPADQAKLLINEEWYQVVEIRRGQEDGISYKLDRPIVGDDQAAFIQIDWVFRYQNMRYHTLLHIISGYLYRKYHALVTSSGIMSDHARLEVEFQEDNVPSEFDPELITQNIQQLIKDDFPVTTATIDRNTLNEEDLIRTYTNLIPKSITNVRLVKIGDFDEQACAGTHVASTGEVGNFKFIQLKNKGRLKKRIKVQVL